MSGLPKINIPMRGAQEGIAREAAVKIPNWAAALRRKAKGLPRRGGKSVRIPNPKKMMGGIGLSSKA